MVFLLSNRIPVKSATRSGCLSLRLKLKRQCVWLTH